MLGIAQVFTVGLAAIAGAMINTEEPKRTNERIPIVIILKSEALLLEWSIISCFDLLYQLISFVYIYEYHNIYCFILEHSYRYQKSIYLF